MIPLLGGLILFPLLLKLSNFSDYFQIAADPTGFSPSIPFLLGLDPLAGREAGIIFLPRLVFPSCRRVQVAHCLSNVVIRTLSVTTAVLTCAVRAVCGPRRISGHSQFTLNCFKAVGRKNNFFFQRDQVRVTLVSAGISSVSVTGWGSHPCIFYFV
jgi:hypothetical protein